MTHRRGAVDSARPADSNWSASSSPASLEADQYRSLRHLVERLNRDSGLHVFAVTSPGSGDGKTVTTLNLAGSLAQSRDTRVLVIDADLHRPSVAEYLGHRSAACRRARRCSSSTTTAALEQVERRLDCAEPLGRAHRRV